MPNRIESSIHTVRWGQYGPRVVMVHGGTQGSEIGGERTFAFQKPLADRGWQLVVPDRPGHGLSPDPGRPDDADADGAWVAKLIGEHAHVVGHSFGGSVALAAVARRPSAVRSLTLIEPAMHAIAVENPQVRRFLLKLAGAIWLSFSAVRRTTRVMDILGIPSLLRRPSDIDEMRRLGRSIRRMRLSSRAVLEQHLNLVRTAKIPLLVVSGGWSPAFEAMSDVVALQGGGVRAVLRIGHHFPQFMAEEFNLLVGKFLIESQNETKEFGRAATHDR